jgi:hypothetical protein
MALTTNCKNRLRQAMSSIAAANEIINAVNATISLSAAESAFLDGAVAGTAAASKVLVLDGSKGISTITSATITTLTCSNLVRASYTSQVPISRAKVGAGAGWVVGGADNLPYVATMAASQTAGTLVIPIHGLHIGDTITAFKVIAQVESAGGIVTIDAALRAVTNVAGEPTDASIGAITQVSVTADTAVAQEKTALTEVVTSGKSYYLLITATTAASTDIILQHPELTVTMA